MIALAKQSNRPLFNLPARGYIWLFHSLPLLVLLIFVYNLPQAAPGTSALLSDPFWAGLIAMVLSESAYIAEICCRSRKARAKLRARWGCASQASSGASLSRRR